MMRLSILIGYFCLFAFPHLAAEEKGEIVTNYYLGEKNLGTYDGPDHPWFFHDFNNGELYLLESRSKNDYLDPYFMPILRHYLNYFQSELAEGESCPNELLADFGDYLRYSYRLVSMSMLYEALLDYQAQAKLESSRSCQINWADFVGECTPKSKDMKKFISVFSSYLKRHQDQNLDQLILLKRNKFSLMNADQLKQDISYSRLQFTCKQQNGRNCYANELSGNLTKACTEDKEIFLRLCSETDEVYGLSQVDAAYGLLIQSNLVNLFSDEEFAMGCMRRYSLLNQHKEHYYPQLREIFTTVSSKMIQLYQTRYIQGRAFPFGALKEFELKGLNEAFVAEKEKPIEVVAPATTASVVVVVSKPEPVKPAEPVKIVQVVTPTVAPKVVEHKSAYLLATELINNFGWERVKVNMIRFRYDYVFNLQQLQILKEKMPIYTSRKVLDEMKKYDKLGTDDGAVPLMFIKFLIDTDQHQSLYNLIGVLGRKFVVLNDIDKKNLVKGNNTVELINDETSNNRWQIVIVNDKEKTNSPESPEKLPKPSQPQGQLVSPQK